VLMGGKDGNVYEIAYQAQDGWFSKRCRKMNHSQGKLTYLVPNFLRFTTNDPIVDMCVDDSRHILYALSNKGTIQVYDLGDNSDGMSYVSAVWWPNVLRDAHQVAPRLRDWFVPSKSRLISIAPILSSESAILHLVATSTNGLRFYFSTYYHSSILPPKPLTGSHPAVTPHVPRPSTLRLVHVRRPPDLPSLTTQPTTTTSAPSMNISSSFMQPSSSASTLNPARPTTYNIHTALYAHGVCFLADAKSEEVDNVVGVFADPALGAQRPPPGVLGYASQQGRALREVYSSVEIQGKAWAVAEVLSFSRLFPFAPSSSSSPSYHDPATTANELAVQHMLPPRQFACLTNAGVYIVVKLRPLDQLLALLSASSSQLHPSSSSSGALQLLPPPSSSSSSSALITSPSQPTDTEALKRFFLRFGDDQACAMCLVLACSIPNSIPSFPAGASMNGYSRGMDQGVPAPDANVVPLASRAFFDYGGNPTFEAPSFTSNAVGGTELGRVMSTPTLRYSGCFSGLTLFVARLIRPVWSSPLTIISHPNGSSSPYHTCRFSKEELSTLQSALQSLLDFLRRNPQFVNVSPSDKFAGQSRPLWKKVLDIQKRSVHEEAIRAEQKAGLDVYRLVQRCLEGMSLLIILSENMLPRIVERMDKDLREHLLPILTFGALVSTDEGTRVAMALINALLSSDSSNNSSVDSLCELVSARCGSFFSMNDVARVKADERVQRARNAITPDDRRAALGESLQLYLRIVPYIDIAKVAKDYVELGFYTGAVDLALVRAKHFDATTALEQGQAWASDPAKRTAADEDRAHCFNIVFSVLDTLNTVRPPTTTSAPAAGTAAVGSTAEERIHVGEQVQDRILGSSDKGLHFKFYEWCIEHGKLNYLKKLRTPYIEEFLRGVNLEWLAQYYEANERFDSAAVLRSQLAEQRDGQLGLRERVKYLTNAVTNARSQPAAMNADFMQDLEEKAEIALVQLRVFEEMTGGADTANISDPVCRDAALSLNKQLFSLSELYNQFAQKYELWESALAIISYADYDDPNLVQRVWANIIDRELAAAGSSERGIRSVAERVKSIGREYIRSPHAARVFPLQYICSYLERRNYEVCCSSEQQADGVPGSSSGSTSLHLPAPDSVVAVFADNFSPLLDLYGFYRAMYKNKEEPWQNLPSRIHLLLCICTILDRMLKGYSPMSTAARYSNTNFSNIEDDVSSFILDLSSSTVGSIRDSKVAEERLKRIQTVLQNTKALAA